MTKSSLAAQPLTAPDNGDVFPRPKPAKVTTVDNTGSESLSRLLLDSASEAHGGKQGAAAAQAGKDEGNFSRDMRRIAELMEKLGPMFLARLGRRLDKRYGPLTDRKAYARQLIENIEAELKELRQFVESSL